MEKVHKKNIGIDRKISLVICNLLAWERRVDMLIRGVCSLVGYLSNNIYFYILHSDVYLHHDESFMPRSSSAWSARNFLATTSRGACVTYWLNLLQVGGRYHGTYIDLLPINMTKFSMDQH